MQHKEEEASHEMREHHKEVKPRAENDAAFDLDDSAAREGVQNDPHVLSVHERLVLVRQQAEAAGEDGVEKTPRGISQPGNDSMSGGVESVVGSAFWRNHSMISVGSAQEYPEEVLRVARQMAGLDERNFLILADLAQRRAWRTAYSLIQYRGSSWYLPLIRPAEPEEERWEVSFSREHGLVITLAGTRVEINVVGYLVRAVLVVLVWFLLWSVLPEKLLEPDGYVFDPLVTVLVAAIVGGLLSRLLQIPPLIGILLIAAVWNTIPPTGGLTNGIHKEVRKIASKIGLTTIVLRAGLSMKPKDMQGRTISIVGLALLPAAIEMVVHAFVAKAVFPYTSLTWAFLQGAITTGVSPSVLVPGVLTLRLEGYSTKGGPSTILLPASPLEMASAIWAINFIVGLLFTSDISLGLNIALGPIQIIVGAIIGVLLGGVHFGFVWLFKSEAQKLPHGRFAREHVERVAILNLVTLLVVGGCLVFYGLKVNLGGGAAIATATFGFTAGLLMRRQEKSQFWQDQLVLVLSHISDFWDIVVVPIFFAMVGSAIDLSALFNKHFFPRALACMFAGYAVRFLFTVLVTLKEEDFSWGERLITAAGWLAKASVQAALGRLALDKAKDRVANLEELALTSNSTAYDHALHEAHDEKDQAQIIANIASLTILITAPLASILFVKLGPKVLRKDA